MRNKSITLLCFLLLLTVCSLTAYATDVLVNESWYIVETQGKAVGFVCDQTWETEKGFRYVSDMTMLMEILQSEPIQVTEHMEEVVDQEYRPISFSNYALTNNSQVITTGEFFTDEVKIKVVADGGKEYNSVWKHAEPVYFSTSLLEILIKQGIKVGVRNEALVWDFTEKKAETGVVVVEKETEYSYNGKTIPGFEIRITVGTEEIRAVIDQDGEMYWSEIFAPGRQIIMTKTEKDQIPQLQAMEADVLIIPGNIQVSRPYSSITSQITVAWRDIPYEEFQWVDNRQSVKAHNVNGNEHQVTVAITKDERDFTGKVHIPVENPELAKYLADTQYIMPSLPAVKELAHQIIGEEKDGWIATQKLIDWMYNNVKFALIPETLTAEQILQKKSGKCVEFAVLFASLARSAGLPTRVALGERYQDNMWVGHMWNEVWMNGEWITVDPSHNQIAPDALLLKFVDSDTVMGTQSVRRRLTSNLQIQIDDVKLVENANSDLKTGMVGQTYTNAEYGCQLIVPEKWLSAEGEDQGVPLLAMQPEASPMVQALMLMFAVPTGTTPELIMDARVPAIKNLLPGFELISQEKTTLLDQPAVLATWTFTQGIQYKQQNLIMISGDVGYLFVFSAPADQWDQYQSGFAQVLQGFTVVE